MRVNFDRNPEGKRYPGRPKLRSENSMKMDRKEVECEDVDWAKLTRDRV
jgi:hypothetical protein